jgi:hypothetical protein
MSDTLEPVDKEAICSFCSTKVSNLAVRSTISDNVICHSCLHKVKVTLGDVPVGALCCAVCDFYRFVRVEYAGGIKVFFSFVGRDDEGCSIYTVVKVNKAWDRKTATFDAAYCGKCDRQIPFKLVWDNPYILPHEQRVKSPK